MCGIFGVVHVRKAAELTAIGLHGNQHRAVDYAGIVSSDGTDLYRETGTGIARKIFTEDKLNTLQGMNALGHVRYPTVVDNRKCENIQPVMGMYGGTPFAIAHNGNLTNVPTLKKLVPAAEFTTSLDTEFIARILETKGPGDLETDLVDVLRSLRGSFSLGILMPDLLIAVRDPHGNRPLSIARLNGGFCISSETCAFPNVDAEFVRDVEPGTMVFIDANGIRTKRFAEPEEKKCRFEAIYFSHPGSNVFGEEVGEFRKSIGRTLERLFPVPGADLVTPIPDSANFIAMGYGESGRSGECFPVIIRSHYVGRTFIAATQALRDAEVAQKFTFSAGEIKGKTIVVVDDSVVRGTTLPKIVAKLRRLGAKAVHVRIGSPPIMHPCIYGINTPTRDELMAASLSVEAIRRVAGADSLEFLPLEALQQLSPCPRSFCFACMSGKYW